MKNVKSNTDNLENSDLKHLYLFFYLIPILGFFPSLWTLYRDGRGAEGQRGLGAEETRNRGAEEQGRLGSLEHFSIPSAPHRVCHLKPLPPIESAPSSSVRVSRLSVTLAFSWLLAYLLLNVGAETSEFLTLRLLVLNSLLTSGYFLVSIWLMVRLASGSSVRLPGFSTFAERVVGKHLS